MTVYEPQGLKKIFHYFRRVAAKNWLSRMPGVQIAITGSQGKTSTTQIITNICQSFGETVATDLNLDTTFNLPITALRVKPSTKYIVWELGIDHPGEMARHLEIAKPKIAVITGISPVHTDAEHMGSLKKLIEEKRRLIEVLPTDGTALLNYDDEHVRGMAKFTKAKVVWYGSDPKKCDVWVDRKSVNVSLEGTTAAFATKDSKFEIKTRLMGIHTVYNIMVGYLVMKAINSRGTYTDFQRIMNQVEPLRGRMNVEPGPFNTVVINDSLRANPQSTYTGLRTLDEISYTKGRKIAVIGEMGELERPEEEHKKTGRQIAKMKFDYVLCIGPLRKLTVDEAIKNGFPKNKIEFAENVFEAADKLKTLLKTNDLWYLKGSLLRNYKRILQILNGEKVCCDATLCPYNHCGYAADIGYSNKFEGRQ
jgi:UDP-N-acetylmuramoyl-tripeptide--D-alanyl-D-alanine ligase